MGVPRKVVRPAGATSAPALRMASKRRADAATAQLRSTESQLGSAQAELTSVKRRLRQYASTLDAVSGHAKEEIGVALGARNSALAAASTAAAERDALSTKNETLTTALAASKAEHAELKRQHGTVNIALTTAVEECDRLRREHERSKRAANGLSARAAALEREKSQMKGDLTALKLSRRATTEERDEAVDALHEARTQLAATKRELALVRHQLATRAPPEISQSVRRDIAEGSAVAVERRMIGMIRAVAKHYIEFGRDIPEVLHQRGITGSESSEEDEEVVSGDGLGEVVPEAARSFTKPAGVAEVVSEERARAARIEEEELRSARDVLVEHLRSVEELTRSADEASPEAKAQKHMHAPGASEVAGAAAGVAGTSLAAEPDQSEKTAVVMDDIAGEATLVDDADDFVGDTTPVVEDEFAGESAPVVEDAVIGEPVVVPEAGAAASVETLRGSAVEEAPAPVPVPAPVQREVRFEQSPDSAKEESAPFAAATAARSLSPQSGVVEEIIAEEVASPDSASYEDAPLPPAVVVKQALSPVPESKMLVEAKIEFVEAAVAAAKVPAVPAVPPQPVVMDVPAASAGGVSPPPQVVMDAPTSVSPPLNPTADDVPADAAPAPMPAGPPLSAGSVAGAADPFLGMQTPPGGSGGIAGPRGKSPAGSISDMPVTTSA